MQYRWNLLHYSSFYQPRLSYLLQPILLRPWLVARPVSIVWLKFWKDDLWLTILIGSAQSCATGMPRSVSLAQIFIIISEYFLRIKISLTPQLWKSSRKFGTLNLKPSQNPAGTQNFNCYLNFRRVYTWTIMGQNYFQLARNWIINIFNISSKCGWCFECIQVSMEIINNSCAKCRSWNLVNIMINVSRYSMIM